MPGSAERADALGLLGRDLARDVGERRAPRQALRDRLAALGAAAVERGADLRRDLGRVVDFGRDGGDRVGVDAVGQHAALAVEDLAALGRRLRRCASAGGRRASVKSACSMTCR